MEIDTEIAQTRDKLNKLEKEKQEQTALREMNDIKLNLDILSNAIKKREDKVKADRYSKSCIAAKFIDRDMIDPMTAIYNILQNLDTRIKILENNRSECLREVEIIE
jgi:hypothetical protein